MFGNVNKKQGTLKLYGIPKKSLKEYTHDNTKYHFENLPDEKYRLHEKEIDYNSDKPKEEKKDPGQDMDELMSFADTLDSTENRFSIKTMDTSQSSGSSNDNSKNMKDFGDDFRSSMIMKSRRPTKVKLEDFDIKS